MTDFPALRHAVVASQIGARGGSFGTGSRRHAGLPREAFLPERLREFAYEDTPLPDRRGPAISQPYIVAFMTDALALQGGEKVLEIGAGSGYAAAVVSRIAGKVYTVELIGQLAEKAASVLSDLGYANVHVLHADGTLGWLENAPYDAIIVAAGGPDVPKSLKQQLKIGGRLVIPVGTDPRALSASRDYRRATTGRKTSPMCVLFRSSGKRGGARKPSYRRPCGEAGSGRMAACPRVLWPAPSRSRRSRMPTSGPCSQGSVMRASCCSASPFTVSISTASTIRSAQCCAIRRPRSGDGPDRA